jgi:diguanylate cyclase (GGDEF)-like protein/PAS domain S-box-containing protein
MRQISTAGTGRGRTVTVALPRQITVLLIEDSDSDAAQFDTMLATTAPGEFVAARVTTLADAMSYLRTTTPDCAVIDLKLTDAEGVELIESLAVVPSAVALIVLTGHADDELAVTGIVAGAIDYLPKNALDGRLLVHCIQHAVLRTRYESSLAEAQSIARLGSWELDLTTSAMTWSRELYRLFGFRLDEQPAWQALVDRTHADDREACSQALAAAMDAFTRFKVEHRIVLRHGMVRWVRSSGRIERDADSQPVRIMGTVLDISEQKAAEDALLHHAFHDPLTGLPNRLLLLDRLGQAVHRLDRQTSAVGVIHLDVDRFKVINDSLGHAVGDQLLQAIATTLAELVRPGDTLARIGGDEFVVLCEGLSGEAEAVLVADRICAAMDQRLPYDGGQVVVSISAGIALADSADVDPNALLRDADAAMHRAKTEGSARSAVFAESMRVRAIGRLGTEMSLRQSIADGDLRVHYQPIVNIADGRVTGHEALVRWQHPARGFLGPDEFIPIAEETGLIVPLGTWVLQQACQQARRFQNLDPMWSGLTMSVNLSGGQLGQRDLIELVASAYLDADLRPEHLQLEMTESVLMDDAANTITILESLKELGVLLGVDDFGTGYSSLAYLKRFPVDVLKIDRSFVSGLAEGLEDSAIVAAIVSLADTIGLQTIAEGVESGRQRDILIGLGCTRAQGYMFARPMPVAEAETALDQAARLLVPGLEGAEEHLARQHGPADEMSDETTQFSTGMP